MIPCCYRRMKLFMLFFTSLSLLVQLCNAIDPGESVQISGKEVSTRTLIDLLKNGLVKKPNQQYGQHIYHRADDSCLDSDWHTPVDENLVYPNQECDPSKPTQQWRWEGKQLQVGSAESYRFYGSGRGDICLDWDQNSPTNNIRLFGCNGNPSENFLIRVHPGQIDLNNNRVYFAIHSESMPNRCLTRHGGVGYWPEDRDMFRLDECIGAVEQSFYLKLDDEQSIREALTLIREQAGVKLYKPSSQTVVISELENYYYAGKLIYAKSIPNRCLGAESSSQYDEGRPFYDTKLVSCKQGEPAQQWKRIGNRLELGVKSMNFPDLTGSYPCLECVGGEEGCFLKIGSCIPLDSESRVNQDFTIVQLNHEEDQDDPEFIRVYFSIHSKKNDRLCATLYQVDGTHRIRFSLEQDTDDQKFYLKINKKNSYNLNSFEAKQPGSVITKALNSYQPPQVGRLIISHAFGGRCLSGARSSISGYYPARGLKCKPGMRAQEWRWEKDGSLHVGTDSDYPDISGNTRCLEVTSAKEVNVVACTGQNNQQFDLVQDAVKKPNNDRLFFSIRPRSNPGYCLTTFKEDNEVVFTITDKCVSDSESFFLNPSADQV